MSKVQSRASEAQKNEAYKADILLKDTDGLHIAPNQKRRRVSDYLSQLKTTIRRPPELALGIENVSARTGIDELLAKKLGEMSPADANEFAFEIASLAWRLEDIIESATDPEVRRGFEELSLAARRYEHLFMLQSSMGATTDD